MFAAAAAAVLLLLLCCCCCKWAARPVASGVLWVGMRCGGVIRECPRCWRSRACRRRGFGWGPFESAGQEGHCPSIGTEGQTVSYSTGPTRRSASAFDIRRRQGCCVVLAPGRLARGRGRLADIRTPVVVWGGAALCLPGCCHPLAPAPAKACDGCYSKRWCGLGQKRRRFGRVHGPGSRVGDYWDAHHTANAFAAPLPRLEFKLGDEAMHGPPLNFRPGSIDPRGN